MPSRRIIGKPSRARAAVGKDDDDLVQVNFRLPAPLLTRVEAAAAAFGEPKERILAIAVEAWLGHLNAHDRQLVDAIIARRNKA